MVTYVDDKLIERETPAYRQDMVLLARYTEKARIGLEFDADRALQRDEEGAAHRFEIINAILVAKDMPALSRSQIAEPNNVLSFVRYIRSMAEITMRQEHGTQAKPSANSPEILDDVKILGDAQCSLAYAGNPLKIDYDLAVGKTPEAGAYRVTLADALTAIMEPRGGGTRPHEVKLHPAYEDPDELLVLAKRVRTWQFASGQGSILT